jgi:hypothetical protein
VDFKEIPINAIHCDPSGTHCELNEMEVGERARGRADGKEREKKHGVGGVVSLPGEE